MNIGKHVQKEFNKLSDKEQTFVGFLSPEDTINNQIRNYVSAQWKNPQEQERITCDSVLLDNNAVVGYQSTCICFEAPPTSYENHFMGLEEPLNFVELERLLVSRTNRGIGAGKRLVMQSLELANELEKDWFVNVVATNKKMNAIVQKLSGIELDSTFKSQSGNELHRYVIKH